MHSGFRSTSEFESEIAGRLGLVPNLFRCAPAAPEVRQQLWFETLGDFIDNPLPALFKQRLFVYLSRLSPARYCLVRQAGFLTGHGRVAGDADAAPQGREELMALLRYRLPDDVTLQGAFAELQALADAQLQLPDAGSALEQALFIVCAALYPDAQQASPARDALYHALGRQWSEQLFQLIGHAAKIHFWVRLHPEIAIEPDMRAVLDADPELSRLLLEPESVPAQAAAQAPGASAQPQPQPERVAAIDANLVGMFNHELRTPVAAISAVSDMLQMIPDSDERLRNACQVLQRQVQAMTRIMDRVLDLSELVDGKLAVAPVATALAVPLQAALREMEQRLEERQIHIELQFPEQSLFVHGDPQRLQQLFESLIGHILARSKAAQPLRITAVEDETALDIRFTLQTAGARRANAVAQPSRLTSATTGLALATTIAELHGGSLEALNEGDGVGGYLLRLPSQGAGHSAEDAAKTRLRVLSIEDNHDFAQLFQHMLQIMGCELEVAADAETGLQVARTRQPQLIFCDIGLPGEMDGYDFARCLRADAQLAHIPLVAVSAYCSPNDVQLAHEAGFDRVCGKPVKFADINAALSAFSNGTLRRP